MKRSSSNRRGPATAEMPITADQVAPGVSAAESYPVEKASRAVLGCLFVVMAVFCVGSFVLRVLVGG